MQRFGSRGRHFLLAQLTACQQRKIRSMSSMAMFKHHQGFLKAYPASSLWGISGQSGGCAHERLSFSSSSSSSMTILNSTHLRTFRMSLSCVQSVKGVSAFRTHHREFTSCTGSCLSNLTKTSAKHKHLENDHRPFSRWPLSIKEHLRLDQYLHRNYTNFCRSHQQYKTIPGGYGKHLMLPTAVQHRDFMNFFGSSQQTHWARAVSEAEKIVGYSTSFMSLRCLLSDELANVALHMRKLVGTKHPLLKTAKIFLMDGKHTLQTRGLIILLMSKAGNASTHRAPKDQKSASLTGGIYASQRALAEISEMIHTAFLVHRGVVNLLNLDPSIGPIKVMELGNKMAVLSGDFLLASACKALAGLRNTVVVELISKAIAHLTEASFMPFRNPDSSPVTVLQPDLTFPDWENYVYLSSGTLIAHSCRGALELSNHSSALTEGAYNFGRNIAWAEQLHTELQPFMSNGPTTTLTEVNLTSAPFILYFEDASKKELFTSSTRPDIRKLVRAIRRSDVIDRAREICESYTKNALESLDVFPSSDSRTALQNIVFAIRT